MMNLKQQQQQHQMLKNHEKKEIFYCHQKKVNIHDIMVK